MLEFNIRNQEISRIDNFSPAEKSVKYLIAKFNFKTEDWNETIKRAIFRNVKSKVEKDAMLEDDSCTVPWEVLVGSGDIEVSVHGISGTKDITTDVAMFDLNRTLQGGSATQEPSPTVYEQMLKEMQQTKEIAQSVRDDADNGEFDGEKGEKGDAGSIKFVIVTELPTENIDTSAIYLVPIEIETEQNKFQEYVYTDGAWECIGSASVEVNLDDYVKKDDYANGNDTYGLVKGNDSGGIIIKNGVPTINNASSVLVQGKENTFRPLTSNLVDYIVKYGLIDNKLEWTDEQKQLARELLGVVGSDDYATSDNGGTTKVNSVFGLSMFPTSNATYKGHIYINKATNKEIDEKTNVYKPIVTSNLDYAVKKALSDCKLSGDDAWTIEEKDNARRTIGIILDPNSDTAYSVPQRLGGGELVVGEPTKDNHSTTKKYVDDGFLAKQQGDTTIIKIYSVLNGQQLLLNADEKATNFSIPRRTGEGQVNTTTPTADTHATTKKYVDDNFILNPKPPTNSILGVQGGETGVIECIGYTNHYPFSNKVLRLAPETEGDDILGDGYLISNTPTRNYHVATKKYVDEEIAKLRAEIEALKG